MNYIDIDGNIAQALFNSINTGEIVDIVNGQPIFYFKERLFAKINGNIKISTYSNEIEPPHFLVERAGEKCRFSLETGECLDKMPNELGRFKKNIQKWFEDNKQALRKFYNDNLPDTAPPTARLHI